MDPLTAALLAGNLLLVGAGVGKDCKNRRKKRDKKRDKKDGKRKDSQEVKYDDGGAGGNGFAS